jgi:hypothetical protein
MERIQLQVVDYGELVLDSDRDPSTWGITLSLL